jgi:hypothetical protein
MKRLMPIPMFLLLATLFSGTAWAGTTRTLWEIGTDDPAKALFRSEPKDHVVYEVGKSDWKTDWPSDERTGAAYEVHFTTDGVPKGVFLLKVRTMFYYRDNAALEVNINGHKGVFYPHPDPFYLANGMHANTATIAIPARYMQKGTNTLIFSAADSDAHATKTLHYGFISMTNESNASSSLRTFQADVIPTVFYRRDNHGQLTELVEAYLRGGQSAPAGSAVLTVNGKRFETKIPAQPDFGETHLSFDVPEWTGTTKALLLVNAGQKHTVPLTLSALRKWTVFMVPHTHVDIGFTDYQGKVAENQATTLSEAAELLKKYPDFRFATDGSWNLQQFLETRSKAEQKNILQLIHDGKIGVPVDYFNLLTGYASLETLYRSLYYSKGLSKKYDLPFNYATTTDVPTHTGAYPSVLASAGVKYWAVGGNADRAPVLAYEQWDAKSPYWWEGPDGQKVLFWYARGYARIGHIFTLDPKNSILQETLPVVLSPYNRSDYKPDAVLIYGAQDENTDLHPSLATFADTWNREFVFPRLQYATFSDFFSYIDKKFGTELPTFKGDGGPYWEDGIGSDSYYAAIDRQNQSDVVSAEIVSTVTHVMRPEIHAPANELKDAWHNILLFAEHSWGAWDSIDQPDSEEAVKQLAVKDNFAVQAHAELEDLTNRSLYQLVHAIQTPSRTMVVFNGLSWKRDALLESDLHRNEQLVDLTTHETIPFEVLGEKDGILRARFLVRDLPPVGYKCIQIQTISVPSAPLAGATATTNPAIENQFYRITVDPESGAVRSIYDKELNKEIVDAGNPYRFGQYLYVTGGNPQHNGQNQIIHSEPGMAPAELTIHPAAHGEYLGARKTPWGYSIRLRSSDVNTPAVNLEILLYDGQKRIELHYTVDKTYTREKEGVYFAFPTSAKSPQFAYNTQLGWVDPAHDMLKGASLEWFSIQKWMAVHDNTMTVGIVPVDAPLASFGDINRGQWPAEFNPKSATLFSYAMNNYWHTNYRAGQGGTFTFRYVITSGRQLDPATLSRTGFESMEAPPVDVVVNNDKVGNLDEPLPGTQTSFLDIDSPNVVLETWKRAEDGKGTVLRLREIAGHDEEATVKLPRAQIRSSELCNAVEDSLHELSVTDGRLHLTFHPHQVLTVRVVTAPGVGPESR